MWTFPGVCLLGDHFWQINRSCLDQISHTGGTGVLPFLAAADVLPLLSYAATFLLKRNTRILSCKQACVSGKVMYIQEAGVALPSNIHIFLDRACYLHEHWVT